MLPNFIRPVKLGIEVIQLRTSCIASSVGINRKNYTFLSTFDISLCSEALLLIAASFLPSTITASPNPEVVLVDQIPSNSWVEGLVIRPNGQAIISRLDQQELWTVDLSNPEAQPKLLHSFPNANGIVNLCALKGRQDEYAVISSQLNLNTVEFHTFIIWRVSLSQDDSRAPEVTKIAEVPDVEMCIAITAATERTLLLGDARGGQVLTLDIETGKTSVLVADESMKRASDEDFFGLNRLRLTKHHLWFTNNSAGTLCRVPVQWDENDAATQLTATGSVEVVVGDVPACERTIA